jgi:hypothetical protein
MRQLQTKLSERMANTFQMASADLAEMVDVLFIGLDGERLGEVQAIASRVGREAVEKLFPECHIRWRDKHGPEFLPDDWKEFTFCLSRLLRDAASLGLQHNLPIDLLGQVPINELNPDQFSTLMVVGADDQGARAALWSISQNMLTIQGGPSTFN